MIAVTIELRGDLPDLLRGRGPSRVTRRLSGSTSVKDAVEALGVPHCEIGSVTAGTQRVDWSYQVRDGDRIRVEPARPQPLQESGFICDRHLGKLARMLRLLGFDTTYDDTWGEARIARHATAERRAILTGSRSLLKRRAIPRGQLIRSPLVDEQVVEVLVRFDLLNRIDLFGRCGRCNGALRTVAKQDVADRIPPRTARWLDTYYICRVCDQLYWEGTHVTALRARIAAIRKNVETIVGS